MADTIGAKVVITRKNHVCFGCGREFPKGSRMEKSFVTGEVPFSCYLCETCLSITHKWCEAKNDLENEFGYSHIWCRLNAIENILGEEYDLEQLRQLVQTTQTGRCKRCRYSRQPSRQTQIYGAPGTLTCRYGPCNRRNVNENDYCSYFAPKEESAP